MPTKRDKQLAEIRDRSIKDRAYGSPGGPTRAQDDVVFLLEEIDRLQAAAGQVFEVIESVQPNNMGGEPSTRGHGLFRTKVGALNRRRELAKKGIYSTVTDTRNVL